MVKGQLGFDAVQILGKSLRGDRERALQELQARSAAAAACLRAGVERVVSVEAPLKGQAEAGSAIVARFLDELGVPRDRMITAELSCSTREEALALAELVAEHRWRRVMVVTASYHVARARRQFEEVLGAGAIAVHCPEAMIRIASDQERAWIQAGVPGPRTLRSEHRVEVGLSALAALLRPLPAQLRWDLEIRAGHWLRGVDDRRSTRR